MSVASRERERKRAERIESGGVREDRIRMHNDHSGGRIEREYEDMNPLELMHRMYALPMLAMLGSMRKSK